MERNTQAFLALVRAGLWEKEAQLASFEPFSFMEVYRLASQQSVVGLVTAGMERMTDVKAPREMAKRFISSVLSLERRNNAMDAFIAKLFKKMETAGIKAMLVKGQGIAQCYERPLWRTCGDVDLFLDEENYTKAKVFLSSLASRVEDEDVYRRHLAMSISHWVVELHGTFRSGLGKRMDAMMDEVQRETFENGQHRVWRDGSIYICLPSPNNDVILVFSHILQHFFREGIGLRQICDWCRLLWKYSDFIDLPLLEVRLRKMGVMSEWKAFATLAVEWLGMPEEAMPFYRSSALCRWKARRILTFVLDVGNFGHNRDESYQKRFPYVIRKMISFGWHTWDRLRQILIFPLDALRAWGVMVEYGFATVRKEKRRGQYNMAHRESLPNG